MLKCCALWGAKKRKRKKKLHLGDSSACGDVVWKKTPPAHPSFILHKVYNHQTPYCSGLSSRNIPYPSTERFREWQGKYTQISTFLTLNVFLKYVLLHALCTMSKLTKTSGTLTVKSGRLSAPSLIHQEKTKKWLLVCDQKNKPDLKRTVTLISCLTCASFFNLLIHLHFVYLSESLPLSIMRLMTGNSGCK